MKIGTAEELDERMTQLEFVRWQAFEILEPFGTEVEDMRFAKLLSQQHGGHPKEYFPPRDPEESEAFFAELQKQRMGGMRDCNMMKAMQLKMKQQHQEQQAKKSPAQPVKSRIRRNNGNDQKPSS